MAARHARAPVRGPFPPSDTALRLSSLWLIFSPRSLVWGLRTFGLRETIHIARHSLRNWKRDAWNGDLNAYWCCSGFDAYGQVGCGCFGITVREYLEMNRRSN